MTENNNKNMYDVVVIGGGPAGLTAALYLARARYRVVVVEKEHFGGQITITSEVVNYPGVGHASGTELTETMRKQAESFGAEFLLTEVSSLDVDGDIKKVQTSRGTLECFDILLATGAHPRMVGFKGEEEFKGHGVAYCATCDGEFFTGKEVFVVGGDFVAAEESIFLTKYAKHVTILIREDDFTCAKSTSDAARNHENITVLTNVQVQEVSGDSALHTLRYENTKTGEVTEYQFSNGEDFGVFIFAGYEPATELVENIVKLNKQGYVETNRQQQTSVEGIYAAGDGALAATELERYAASMQEKTGIHPVNEPPCVQVFLKDGTDTGLAFHGVPGGHEFTSFILGLYNAAGPGQALDEEIVKQIQAVKQPVEMQIMVSLSCTMCPELVTAAQKIAALNPMVKAEVYDLNHFPDMKEKYHVMSVPCMVINDDKVTFGKKNIPQVLELIS